MLQATQAPGGTRVPVVGPPAKLSRTPVRVRDAAPALGAHSDEILAELGLGAEARRSLFASGVAAAPTEEPD